MTLFYGGDYNPEQWPEDVWDEDVRLMRQAKVNLVTVGVFAWSLLEPTEGHFTFEWLDRILDKLHDAGIGVDLATATASPPPWLTHNYPAVLPVTEDGVRLWPGSRQHYCPSSPDYRRLAGRLVGRLVDRYANHPAVQMWHINNEYGCHVSRCYCDTSAEAFRKWLKKKYGSIEALNNGWGTAFWSQRYNSFDEILPPRAAPTFRNPAQLLDFERFSSDELLDCYRAEAAVVRASGTSAPLTTNFLGITKATDYWAWAQEVDIVSWDNYPDPVAEDAVPRAAMAHDLMRSVGHGRPWLLMEQSASSVSWLSRNAPKAPGQLRAFSYQALARGADGILYFQWRQSSSGAEKFLTGLVPHPGTETRVWSEVRELGGEIAGLEDVAGTRLSASVAIVFDWESWWSLEQEALPARISYPEQLFAWYRLLHERNVLVDFVKPAADLSAYRLVIAPSLFVSSAPTADQFEKFVDAGGTLLVTYQSGVIDEFSRLGPGSYLGYLGKVLGIRVEEFAPLGASTIGIHGDELGSGTAHVWSDHIRVDDADVVAEFDWGTLQGYPAITARRIGSGSAWYTATLPDEDLRRRLVTRLLSMAGVSSFDSGDVEVVQRGSKLYVINHSPQAQSLRVPTGTDRQTELHLTPFDVKLIDVDPVASLQGAADDEAVLAGAAEQ